MYRLLLDTEIQAQNRQTPRLRSYNLISIIQIKKSRQTSSMLMLSYQPVNIKDL